MPRPIPQFARILVTALVTAGCVVSTEAVITDADSTFDERLLGTWAEQGGSDTAVVRRGAGNVYAMTYTMGSTTGRFEARLGRLGDRFVLDVRPTPETHELPLPYRATLLPVHLAVFIDIGPDEVRIALLEPDSLRAALEAGRVRLAASGEQHQLALRGTTAELRAALPSHLARPGTLGAPGVFSRVR